MIVLANSVEGQFIYFNFNLFISTLYLKKSKVSLRPQIPKANRGGRSNTQSEVNNGNWTEWSAIWSEIIRVISKSNERAARVRFEITSMISDQNCTTRSSITTLLDPFWNRTINSLQCKHKNYKILDCTNIKFIFFEPSCQICQTMAFLSFIFLQCDWLV